MGLVLNLSVPLAWALLWIEKISKQNCLPSWSGSTPLGKENTHIRQVKPETYQAFSCFCDLTENWCFFLKYSFFTSLVGWPLQENFKVAFLLWSLYLTFCPLLPFLATPTSHPFLLVELCVFVVLVFALEEISITKMILMRLKEVLTAAVIICEAFSKMPSVD